MFEVLEKFARFLPSAQMAQTAAGFKPLPNMESVVFPSFLSLDYSFPTSS